MSCARALTSRVPRRRRAGARNRDDGVTMAERAAWRIARTTAGGARSASVNAARRQDWTARARARSGPIDPPSDRAAGSDQGLAVTVSCVGRRERQDVLSLVQRELAAEYGRRCNGNHDHLRRECHHADPQWGHHRADGSEFPASGSTCLSGPRPGVQTPQRARPICRPVAADRRGGVVAHAR